jgi:hypothetical protein
MKPLARRCTAQRKDGRPCRSWAVRDSDEALCASHLKAGHGQASRVTASHRVAKPLGFYSDAYSVEEATDHMLKNQSSDLKDELAITRLAVRHALLLLKQEPDPAQYARLIAQIFKGARTIAGIMRVQRSISPDQNELLPPEILGALEEMSAENDYDL